MGNYTLLEFKLKLTSYDEKIIIWLTVAFNVFIGMNLCLSIR